MRHFLRCVPAVGLALALAGTGGSRPPLARDDAPKAGELPAGAKLRLGGDRMMFRGVSSVSLLPPDYKTIIAVTVRGELRKFDLITGEPLNKDTSAAALGGGQVVVSGDGKRCVHMGSGIINVREVATGKTLRALKPPPRFFPGFTTGFPLVSLSHDGTVLAQGGISGDKGAVAVWDVGKGELLFQAGVQHIAGPIPILSPDGKYLATRPYQILIGPRADKSPVVTVWQVDGGKELFTIRPTGSAPQISTIAFSPDGDLIAVACGDGPIDVWDVKAGKAKHVLFGRTGQGVRVAFSPDGKSIAAAATDGSVQRWHTADGKLIDATDGPAALPLNATQGVAFVTNDRVITWGAVGQFPVAWEAPSGKLLTALPEHTTGIRSLGFAAGGKEIVTAGQDGRVVRWDAATGKVLGAVELKPSRGLSAAVNRLVMTVSSDGTRGITAAIPNAVFDLTTGAEEYVVPRGPVAGRTVFSLVSADGTRVVSTSVPLDQTKAGTCTVWDVANRRKVAEFEVPAGTGPTTAAAFSPDGTRMVTAGYSPNPAGGPQVLRVTGWDLKTGKKLGQVEDINSRGAPFVAAASNSFAVVMTSGRLRAFDYETGRGGDEFEPRVYSGAGPVVFAPGGKRFVDGGHSNPPNYGVRVREWPTGKVLHTFIGHAGPVTALVFSPDGKTLASGSQDGTVLLWDMTAVK